MCFHSLTPGKASQVEERAGLPGTSLTWIGKPSTEASRNAMKIRSIFRFILQPWQTFNVLISISSGVLLLDIPAGPALTGLKISSLANGDPSRKQISLVASTTYLAPGHLPVLHCCCHCDLWHPLSPHCHSHCSLNLDQPHVLLPWCTLYVSCRLFS